MKLKLFFLIFFLNFELFAQDLSSDRWFDDGDDTSVLLPPGSLTTTGLTGRAILFKSASNGGQEEFLKLKVSDASTDFFAIRNATSNNGKFIPAIYSHNETDNRISLSFGVSTSPSYDFGNEPLIKFETRTYTNGETQENVAAVLTRPMCAWTNLNQVKMLLSSSGNLGIGTTSPTAQLHTTSSVRFENLPFGFGNSMIMGDVSGTLSRFQLPSGSYTAFATTTPAINSLPRFNSQNVFVNSQIFDNGNNIGIGGLPAFDAKVTVYGVVNTLSDQSEKTNFAPIENALEKVNQLNGYTYDWKSTGEKQVGLIAQEVEKVLPELVTENTDGKKFLNYDGVIPVLTEAIKQQQVLIEKQSKLIEELQKEMKDLKKKKK